MTHPTLRLLAFMVGLIAAMVAWTLAGDLGLSVWP